MSCYVHILGGLGNQMFQLATAYAHCRRIGKKMQSSGHVHAGHRKNVYWQNYFRSLIPLISFGQKPSPSSIIWNEPGFSYAPIPAEAAVLYGYFQSSRYFQEYAEDIRKMFYPGADIHIKMLKKHGGLLVTKPDATVLHIRRGDYVNLPKFHCILTPGWYKRSLALIESKPKDIVVFSDDIAWCRGLDFLQGATFVDEPDEVVALHLMSQFRHFVLSNSSFSWWAAWLSGSDDVIVPDHWFGPDGPQDTQDIYEPMWRKVSLEDK